MKAGLKKPYWCGICGQELDKEDIEDGLKVGEFIAIFCSNCDQYIIIDVKDDKKI